MTTVYTNLYEITELQQKIMRFIDYWVHTQKIPVPQKDIIVEMETRGEKNSTITHSLTGLLRLGYIRKAVTNSSGEDGTGARKTKYVMLRRI